jgi:hypothetical protein
MPTIHKLKVRFPNLFLQIMQKHEKGCAIMSQKQLLPQQSVAYYFVRSKSVHEEEGEAFITLFARLCREQTYVSGGKKMSERESVWVDIDEVKVSHATEKMLELPNRIQNFVVPENVFIDLVKTAKTCPKELYFVAPIHIAKF